MDSIKTEHTTRTLGESQGYLALHVTDVELSDGYVMVSSWQPTQADIDTIVAGGVINVMIVGASHPPIGLNTNQRLIEELADDEEK